MDERRSAPPPAGAPSRRRRRRLTAERLEPRVLLSADLLAGAHDGGIGQDDLQDEQDRDDLLVLSAAAGLSDEGRAQVRTALDLDALAALTADLVAEPAVADDEAQPRRELILVDGAVDDPEALIAAITQRDDATHYEIVELDALRGGVEQVSALLAGGGPVSAIHVLGHGADGGFRLGSDWIDLDALPALADELGSWSAHLTSEADLLLYGCDVAGSDAGVALLEQLAHITGADVAASDDPTGAEALGGDWTLEARVGSVETASPFETSGLEAFVGLLAPTPSLLRFSSAADVTGATGAAGGATAWSDQALVTFEDPSLALGATTDGTFSPSVFDIEPFIPGASSTANVDAFHYVTTDLTIGTANTVDLQVGDLLLSIDQARRLLGSDGNDINIRPEDVFVFRPTQPGDYTSGIFLELLDRVDGTNADIVGISLVEATTAMTGSRTLNQGDFLYLTGNGEIRLLDPGDLAATDIGTREVLIDGAGLAFGDLNGIEFVEADITVGGVTLTAGDIALTQDSAALIDGLLGIDVGDVFVMDFTTTTADDGVAVGTASLLFDASDVGLGGALDALALTPPQPDFAPTVRDVTVSATEDAVFVFSADDFGYADGNLDPLASIEITVVESVGSLTLEGADVTAGQTISRADLDAGRLQYAPLANDSGAAYDAFTFRASDGGLDSGTATLTIDVVAVNDAPTVADATLTLAVDASRALTIADFGYADVEGEALVSVTITRLAAAGSLTLAGVDVALDDEISRADIEAGDLVFTPGAGESGLGYASIDFTASDGTDASNEATLTFDVLAPNTAPVLAGGTLTIDEDTPRTVAVADLGFSDADGDALTSITITRLEAAGTLTLAGVDVAPNEVITRAQIESGDLVFTPAANANGLGHDSFDFTASDGMDDSTTATITIDVTAVDDPPTVADATLTIDEDTPRALMLADLGYADVEGTPLVSITITRLEAAGTLTLASADVALNEVITRAQIENGDLVFTPAANANGLGHDSFDFTASDGTDDSTTATITIDVTAVNDPPTVADATLTIDEDTPRALTLADLGYADVEGTPLVSITITRLEAAGTLTLAGADVAPNEVITRAQIESGDLVFTPAANANGLGHDSFDFTASDGALDSSAATITFDVTAVNDSPTVADATLTIDEDTPRIITTVDLGFADIEGDGLASITVTRLETAGSLTLDGVDVTAGQIVSRIDIDAGRLVFTPAPDANGPAHDSFDFTASDGADASNEATITFDVTPVNDPPTAAGATLVVDEDTPRTLAIADFGFTDVDGDALATVTVTRLETVGALTLAGVDVAQDQVITRAEIEAGDLVFTPAADANGPAHDSFEFRASDGLAESAEATLVFDVSAVNDAPSVADNTVATDEDVPYVFGVDDFAFADVDGDALQSIEITVPETVGSLTLAGVDVTANQVVTRAQLEAGSLIFTPAPSGNGVAYDFFRFRASDGLAFSAEATLTIDVGVVNDAPVVADGVIETDEDLAYVLGLDDFGFTDLDGDDLATVRITSLESAGRLTLGGVDVALNQVIARADIVAGSLVYTPDANGNGLGYDVFRFRASDGSLISNEATLTVNVAAVNDAPTAVDRTLAVAEDDSRLLTAADFGFADVDGDALASVTITRLESAGTLTLAGVDVALDQVVSRAQLDAGELRFAPAPGATGIAYASFDFTVSDRSADSNEATITIDVSEVNDAPTVADGTLTTDEDTPRTLTAGDFGYADAEGDPLASVRITQPALVGELTLDGVGVVADQIVTRADIDAGRLVYAPPANGNGSGLASFDFRASDGVSESGEARLTIDVTAVNDAPTAAAGTLPTDEDVSRVLTLGDFGFDDVDGDALASVTITALEAAGRLTVAGADVALNDVITRAQIENGDLVFTPAADENGVAYAAFEFTASDGALASNRAVLTFDVAAVNDAPTVASATLTLDEDGARVLLAADFDFADVDGDALASLTITRTAAVGTLTLGGAEVGAGQVVDRADIDAGRLVFTPAADGSGIAYDSFDFIASDGVAASAPATLTFDVAAVNDVPTAADARLTVDQDAVLTLALGDLGFDDADGDALAAVRVTSAGGAGALLLDGVAVVDGQLVDPAAIAAGRLTYTPAPGESGDGYDAIRFRVSDGVAESAERTLTIDVTPDNAPPVAVSGGIAVTEDTPTVLGAERFGFTDPDGDGLAFVRIVGVAGGGELTLDGNEVLVGQLVDRAALDSGLLSYRPAADAEGPDQARIDFRVGDGLAESGIAALTVDVTPVADAPRAVADVFATDEDSVFDSGAAAGVLANDVDPDVGDLLVVEALASGTTSVAPGERIAGSGGGEFVVTEAGALLFDPGDDFQDLPEGGERVTTVDYVVADATGQSVRIPISLTVIGLNDVASAGDDAGSTASDAVFSVGASAGLLANDMDPDQPDTLTVVAVGNGGETVAAGTAITGTAGGRFTILPDGGYLFDPADLASLATGSQQTTEVTYTIADASGATTTAKLSISVIGVAGAPGPQTGPTVPVTPTAPSTPVADDVAAPAVDAGGATGSGGGSSDGSGSDAGDDGGTGGAEAGSDGEGGEAGEGDAAVSRQLQLALLLEEDVGVDLEARAARVSAFGEFTAGSQQLSSVLGADLQALRRDTAFEALDPRFEALDGVGRSALIELSDPLLLLASPDYRDSLDEAREEAQRTAESGEAPIVAGSLTLTTGVSVAYVLWLVRSGVIVSSVLSALPLWRLVDPLPILTGLRDDEDEESIEDIVAGAGPEADAPETEPESPPGRTGLQEVRA